MKSVFKIKILLASPGNLSEDRDKVSEIVKNINLDSGQREGFVAEIVSWETHTRPAAGEYTQGVINDQFPDDIDIFVGMMGTYFGTPTKRWGSGTEEEFRIAFESWEKTKTPEIMFYFSDAMSSLSQIDPEQLSKRNSFRNSIGKLGVYYFTYTDVTKFQFNLLRQISSAIHEVLKNKKTGVSEEAIPQESAISLKNYNDLLAQDPLVNANSILDKANNQLDTYSELQTSLTADLNRLARTLSTQSRNIERANQNGKPQKFQKAIDAIYNEMNSYSKKLLFKVPKLSTHFSVSIMSYLRFAKMVKANALGDVMPLTGIVSTIAEARTSLSSLIDAIHESETGFADWPEEISDLMIQKKRVIALHQDWASSLRTSRQLLDQLTGELS